MDPYQEGYEAAFYEDLENPYTELSPEWVEFERGWDDGYDALMDEEFGYD